MDHEFERIAREIFAFLERVHGAGVSRGPDELRYDLGGVRLLVYPRPPHARQGGVRLQVPLDEGAPYRFDLAEVVWYRTTLSPVRDRYPAYQPRAGYEERLLQVQAGRMRMYCPDVLAGDLDVFRELVELRRAGGAPDPRAERWSWFTSRPPLSPLDDAVNLPSPDGTLAATMQATEVHMSGPMRGTLWLSNGRGIGGCSPVMVWSDDSRFLAAVRIIDRTTRLVVVRARDALVAESWSDVGFPPLVSLRDGIVVAADGQRFDVRHAIRRLDGPG